MHLHGEGKDHGLSAVPSGLLAACLGTLRRRPGGHGVLAAGTVAKDKLRNDVPARPNLNPKP
jgi:hypothetical protein